MVRFGETADENTARRGNEGDVWIKGFKEGSTRVRFLQVTGKWVTYREHYSEGPGFFPCSEDTATCPGCTDPSEKVQKRSRKYAMNCLGESGRVDVHKVGSRVYKTMKAREQRLADTGGILDRDYTIIRSGAGLDTIYDIEPGDRYELDDPGSLELHEIGPLLEALYVEACEAYGIDIEDQGDDPSPEPVSQEEPAAKPELAKATSAKKVVTPEKPMTEPEIKEATADPIEAIHKGLVSVTDADTGDLRKFLEIKGIEFPPRTPRGRLEKLVTDWVNENPPF